MAYTATDRLPFFPPRVSLSAASTRHGGVALRILSSCTSWVGRFGLVNSDALWRGFPPPRSPVLGGPERGRSDPFWARPRSGRSARPSSPVAPRRRAAEQGGH